MASPRLADCDIAAPRLADRDEAPVVIAVGGLHRATNLPDAKGQSRAPWTRAEIINTDGFDRQPAVGQKVTIVGPLGLPNLELAITAVDKQEIDPYPVRWLVELDEMYDPAYLSAPTPAGLDGADPFGVIVLWPPVPGARWLPPDRSPVRDLPSQVTRGTVTHAVDLDGDGHADAVITSFCCLTRARPDVACEETCSETWMRKNGSRKKGEWFLRAHADGC
jgi:hypothetical protein